MAKDNTYQKIIMGIDPGTNISGYGVIGIERGEIHLISMGIFDLRKEPNQAMKLQSIFDQASKLIDTYLPDEFAIEAPFFGKNPQSMLKLGRAQGVSMAAALHRRIPVFEYSPKRVKQSVTGNGNASKEQVAGMVQALLRMESQHSKYDATDAIAIAICHHFMSKGGSTQPKASYSSWQSFLSNNPDRIK